MTCLRLLAGYSCLRVRLTKKLALCLNGVDLTDKVVGEIFDVEELEARLLVLEGWAELVEAPPADMSCLANEQPNAPFWQVVDRHRNGKKDKLA